MDKLGENLDRFRRSCKAKGFRLTPQRIAIYEALLACEHHPGAEDISRAVRTIYPDISMDTVYRTLNTFSKIGLIHPVDGHGRPRRYDPIVEPHHHFRCKQCDRIIDFYDERLNRVSPPDYILQKFTVSSVKVTLEGVCDQCSQPRKSTRAAEL